MKALFGGILIFILLNLFYGCTDTGILTTPQTPTTVIAPTSNSPTGTPNTPALITTTLPNQTEALRILLPF